MYFDSPGDASTGFAGVVIKKNRAGIRRETKARVKKFGREQRRKGMLEKTKERKKQRLKGPCTREIYPVAYTFTRTFIFGKEVPASKCLFNFILDSCQLSRSMRSTLTKTSSKVLGGPNAIMTFSFSF